MRRPRRSSWQTCSPPRKIARYCSSPIDRKGSTWWTRSWRLHGHADREGRDPGQGGQERDVTADEQRHAKWPARELRAHPRQEQGHCEQDDTEDVVRGALDVAVDEVRRDRRLRVYLIGLRSGGELVLGHRERRERCVRIREWLRRDPSVHRGLELRAEALEIEVLEPL